ncbi:MAG: phospholipase D-like domain-containing protein [Limnoraphis robusta]
MYSLNSSQNKLGFDLQTLLNLQPPRAHCQKCLGLLTSIHPCNEKGNIPCPVCGVETVASGETNAEKYEKFRNHYKALNLYIEFDNIIEHAQKFASIAQKMHPNNRYYPPVSALLDSLNQAQSFVHINSFGISRDFLLTLKLLAQKIPVRGIIALTSDQLWLRDELQNYSQESPNLQLKAVYDANNWATVPHQKLIVIDGLIAFKGSTNLTLTAWRKAAQGYDNVELVTNLAQVIELHNRFFSPLWANLSPYGNAIALDHSLAIVKAS